MVQRLTRPTDHVNPSRIRKATPQRGSTDPCNTCGIPIANEHSNRQAGICLGIRSGKITLEEGKKQLAALSR